MTKEYIAYRGDRPLGTGTIEELADRLGYTYKEMKYKSYPLTHIRDKGDRNAILLYEIEDDEDDNQF
ncbi:hypothetical protein ACUW9Z_000909 [Aerococcus sp. 150760007-1]|uniref:Integrase n=1 Tax=Aerococcus urinaeequi TaxID=51665 RepID=A0ABR5ZXU1_9LACT|nr:integrase [Aerococcus urinaeequi]MBA5746561.1 integrase [Aerococcus urinaeequi]MBA5829388.1 integrase [Aerococcus urinaeequi]MBA5860249.1 integrase [Aerococcus urinaeequi]